jgi:hypothetical protein
MSDKESFFLLFILLGLPFLVLCYYIVSAIMDYKSNFGIPKFHIYSVEQDFKNGKCIYDFISKHEKSIVYLRFYYHDDSERLMLKNGYINSVWKKDNEIKARQLIIKEREYCSPYPRYWINGWAISGEDSVVLENLKGKDLLKFYDELCIKYPMR